jgi:hypothetical protein
MVGPKRNEIIGGWRNQERNVELHNFYSSPNSIIRMIKSRKRKWMGHVARMGEKVNTYRVLVRKTRRKETTGKPKLRLEDNIKMDLRKIRWGVVHWIHLAQDRDHWRALVNTVMNLGVP